MATKPSVPSLLVRDPRYALIMVHGQSDPLAQVRSISPSSTANRDKKTAIAIGDEEATNFFGPPDYTHKVDIEVYASGANDDAVFLLGAAAALDPGESIELDSTVIIDDVTIDIYNGTGGLAVKELSYVMTNFTPLSLELRVDASSGDALVISISGECTAITLAKPS